MFLNGLFQVFVSLQEFNRPLLHSPLSKSGKLGREWAPAQLRDRLGRASL